MKTLILFYSYTGNTKTVAQRLAAQESDDIVEIKDIRRPGKFKAYTLGCFAALRGKAWPIEPLEVDWTKFDRLILLSPVWAGNPPPEVYAVLAQLPEGKSVSVKMISGSGKCGCRAKIESAIQAKGSTPADFEDIKS